MRATHYVAVAWVGIVHRACDAALGSNEWYERTKHSAASAQHDTETAAMIFTRLAASWATAFISVLCRFAAVSLSSAHAHRHHHSGSASRAYDDVGGADATAGAYVAFPGGDGAAGETSAVGPGPLVQCKL